MILIDDRVGSIELSPLFRPYDVQVCSTRLDFGDLCFVGNGEDGQVTVGIERKTIHDLVSSMRSKRLSGYQLPGLMRSYQVVYLVVEGIMQAGDRGQADIWVRGGWRPLLTGSKPILYREIDHYLSTLQHVCGVVVERTAKPNQTVAWVVSRYKWWNDKTFEQHKSHHEIYAPAPERPGRRLFGSSGVGLVEKMAAQLPGVDRKAFDIGKRFRSVYDMVNAGEGEWVKVKGVGKGLARKIYTEIRRG